MSYELRLILVDYPGHSRPDGSGAFWGRVLAYLELGSFGPRDPLVALKSRVDNVADQELTISRAFVFGLDGDTPIVEDEYGKALRVIPILAVQGALTKSLARDPNNREVRTALALVAPLLDTDRYDQTRTFAILFGH